jgi:hypothetical protein
MISRLYVNGCSWTDGDVLEINGLFEKLNITDKGRDYSYPTLVAKHFNYDIIDESRYGGSTNRIVRMCWDFLHENFQFLDSTVFLLEIPNGVRHEVYSNKYKKFFNISSGSLSHKTDITETSEEFKFLKPKMIDAFYEFFNEGQFILKEYINFMNLLFFLKTKNIPFFILQSNSLHPNSHLFNDIFDEHNVIKIADESFKVESYDFIQQMCENEKMSIGDEMGNTHVDTHPGISGHKKISEIVIKHMEKYLEKNIKHVEIEITDVDVKEVKIENDNVKMKKKLI